MKELPPPTTLPSASPTPYIFFLEMGFICNSTEDECVSQVAAPTPFPGIVSDTLMLYLNVINWSIVCLLVSVLGGVTNAINMIVFARTGFKESINMSLFALAISDFGSCVTLIWSTVSLNPLFQNLDLTFDPLGVQYIISAWPHVAFTKITTLITAFVTFERYLCVWKPLKVKRILTRKRVICYLIFSYLVIIGLMAVLFYANRLGYVFYADLNKTLLGYVYTDERDTIENVIVFPFFNILMSCFAFVFIIVCTTLLILKLRQTAKWRLKATLNGTGKTEPISNERTAATKEQKISRMVATLSTLFIICFFPTVATQLAMWTDSRMAIDGPFSNLVVVLAYFTFTSESINSAINIFVYYKNSSNYKAVFDQIFKRERTRDK